MASDRNSSIDLLRATAISMVVAVHSAQNFSPLTESSGRFASTYGAFGVQLFFIASAYTMMLTFGRSVNVRSVLAFYVRRFFRIAPLFWIAGVMYLLRDGFGPKYWAPEGVSALDVLLTFTFLHGLSPNSLNAIVPGGWSIAVEMAFYAIFPVFAWLYFVLKRPNYVYLIIIAIYLANFLVSMLLAPYLKSFFEEDARYIVDAFFFFWLPRQMLAFGFGILLYQIIEERTLPMGAVVLFIAVSLFTPWGVTVMCLFLFSYFVLSRQIQYSIATVIGQASYSIYLLHFAVISLCHALVSFIDVKMPFELAIIVVGFISLLLAKMFTKPLIENTFISIGKQVSKKIGQKYTSPQVALPPG